jgi:hypothetical protein
MTCIFDIKLSTSDVIALLALLVAGLSALYARWSWREARKANQISLLVQKKEIYDAFFALKIHMTQKAEFAEMKEVSKFYYPAKNANICLPSKLAKSIDTYFDACFWIADIHQRTNGMTKESREECKPHIATERCLAPKIESEIIELLKESQA